MRLVLRPADPAPAGATFADGNGDGIDDDTGLPVPEEDASPTGDAPTAANEHRWLLCVEGTPTGDGREFAPSSITWRELPLPFMATDETGEGHIGAKLVANLVRIEREGADIYGYTVHVESDDPRVLSLQRLIDNGDLRGVSVDIDAVEGMVVIDTNDDVTENADGTVEIPMTTPRQVVTAGRIMGATAVPFPAFAEARRDIPAIVAALEAGRDTYEMVQPSPSADIYARYDGISFDAPDDVLHDVARAVEWATAETPDAVFPIPSIAAGEPIEPDEARRALAFLTRHAPAYTAPVEGPPPADRVTFELHGGHRAVEWLTELCAQMDDADVITAALVEAPVAPPAWWFDDPQLPAPTPLTITDDGRVYGHLALWDSCHVGFSDRCIRPPRSAADYAHFHSGEVKCDDGTRVRVGQITVDSGHASLSSKADAAKNHYDHTGWGGADLRVGEDEHGIWMAGAARPGLSDDRLRRMMASDVSGDWRRIDGGLELVGIASVNVPGFVKTQYADGMAAALVASVPVCTATGDDPAYRVVADRIAASIGRSAEQRQAERDRIAWAAGRHPAQLRAAVRARVKANA